MLTAFTLFAIALAPVVSLGTAYGVLVVLRNTFDLKDLGA